MDEGTVSSNLKQGTVDRAQRILDDFIIELAKRTDLLFAWLFSIECVVLLGLSIKIGPAVAPGFEWLTAVLGGILTLGPLALVVSSPGSVVNRYVVAVCQMLVCALFIFLNAGRTESVFIIYISLAILTFYRNIPLLGLASAVAVLDFLLLWLFWPPSSILQAQLLEYCAWVGFEDIFIMIGCRHVLSEWRIASRHLAVLEEENTRETFSRVEKEKQLRHSVEMLREHEQRTSAILERAYEAYVAIDEQGRITDWNQQAEHTFGWSKLEILGQTLSQTIIPPAFRDQHERGLQRFLETGKGTIINKSIEVPALHRDGHEFPIELSVTPVRIGNNLTICAFLRDITERKKLIEELGQARDKAQEASRLKSQFVANMSHEIRTPMNGIIGMSNILLKTDLNRKQYEYANTIRDAGMSLLGIINDILDLSKIEAEKIELEHLMFSPTGLIEGIGELLASQAKSKGLTLMTFVAPQVPAELMGDTERLKQILLNLTGNAIKFSEKGKVTVSATVESESDQTITLRFTVTDTGVGISEEESKLLFQPFVQADGTISRKYGGTGLGLSISKRLVELMGGEIGVESVKGQGSTFWFKVAFDYAGAASLVRQSHESLKNVRVLIVDDEPYSADMLVSYLDSWGLRSEKVSDVESADKMLEAAIAEENAFQVAVINLHHMQEDGGNPGLELGKRIFADKEKRATRLILVHDLDDVDSALDAVDIGFRAALSRPLKQSKLFDSLARIMSEPTGKDKGPGKVTQELAIRARVKPIKRKELILIADDHPINQEVMALHLADLGFDSHRVNNGNEVIAAIAGTDYALVLMDCQMPELDGLETTRAIRKAETGTDRHIPIVAMTAHAMKGDRDNCLAAGMDDYISKPINEEELQAALDRWIPLAEGVAALKPGSGEGEGEKPTVDISPDVTEDEMRETFARLDKLFGKEKMRSLLEMFISDSDSAVAQLKQSVDAADGKEVAARAHYLKGACGMLKAPHMQKICLQIEQAGASGDWELVKLSLDALDHSFELMRRCIKELAPPDGN